jgi:hypothetical protein
MESAMGKSYFGKTGSCPGLCALARARAAKQNTMGFMKVKQQISVT